MSNPGVDGTAYVKYTVEFATILRGFEEFLIDLYNNSTNKEIVVKGDEKVTT